MVTTAESNTTVSDSCCVKVTLKVSVVSNVASLMINTLKHCGSGVVEVNEIIPDAKT